MKKKQKILLIISFILILFIAGGLSFFLFRPKPQKEQKKEIPLFEEELWHEETVYPEEKATSPQDKSLVRERGKTKIFWLQNKKIYPLVGKEIIALMRGITGWDKIREVPPESLKDFQQGPDFIAPEPRSEGILIKMKDTEYIFQINGQGKREYLTKQDFAKKELDPKDIITVSTKIIKMLPPAPPIDHLSLQEAVKRGGIELIGSGKYFQKGVLFLAGPYEENTAINIEKGDVLLSKSNKQSLIVTQDFEVFVPKGERITLEGLWVACIDRFKNWPVKGEKLDVTLNIKDWKLKSAAQLAELIKIIDKKGINREQFAQEAIWKITDNQPVGEKARALLEEAGINPDLKTTFLHLANPNAKPGTNFVLPPELSLLGLVANYYKDCPPEKEADKIICQKEMKLAFEVYLKDEVFPGTVGQKIDSKILSLLLSFYLTQKSIDETLSPLSQEEINQAAETLLKQLKKEYFPFPKFKVEKVSILTGHIAEQESITFAAKGQGIKAIEVKVFNLKGEKVFESGKVFGNLFEWHLRDNQGNLLPNGFYSYQIKAEGFEKGSFESGKRQLIIRL